MACTLEKIRHGSNCEFRGFFQWITIDTGANTWKGDAGKSMAHGDFERRTITGLQQFSFTMQSILPDGTDRVNDVSGWEPVAAGDLRLSCFAAAEQSALMQEIWSRRPMDRPVHATSTQQA